MAAQGLGAALLQPLGALLVILAAGGLAATRPQLALPAAALAIIEAATVIWWSLFSAAPGASSPAIVLAVLLWTVPCLMLLIVIKSRADGRVAVAEAHVDVGTRLDNHHARPQPP